MRPFPWFLALCLLSGLPPTHAASFDCAKAQTRVEQLVCTHPTLSRLDDMLAVAYSDAEQVPDAAPDLRQQQRLWLRQRATCQSIACLEMAYERRIIELESQAECLEDLVKGGCASSHQARTRLPRTADGRLMLLSQQECRVEYVGGTGGKSQEVAIPILADCIEAGVYDLCDEGSLWSAVTCLMPHMEVQERRIRRSHQTIRSYAQASMTDMTAVLEQAHRDWVAKRESICFRRYEQSRDEQHRLSELALHPEAKLLPDDQQARLEILASCRFEQLNQRAEKMENWADHIKKERGSAASIEALTRFLAESKPS